VTSGTDLCVIPARGGSKRIPRKNIRMFAGLPMIAHAIRAARDSGCFARIVVSTDDAEISAVAREHGAETPFVRNAALSNDTAGTAEVVIDAIERLGSEATEFTCCLYPTAAMTDPADLRNARDKLAASAADSLLPVVEFDYPPARALRIEKGGRAVFHWPEFSLARSQDVPHLVHDAGAFYWMRTKPFLASRRIVGDNCLAFPVDRLRYVDIDTEDDLRLAEALAATFRKGRR
jgi:N-acylneuraminate cytidylyltransferase